MVGIPCSGNMTDDDDDDDDDDEAHLGFDNGRLNCVFFGRVCVRERERERTAGLSWARRNWISVAEEREGFRYSSRSRLN